jgi:hypothetical protein
MVSLAFPISPFLSLPFKNYAALPSQCTTL